MLGKAVKVKAAPSESPMPPRRVRMASTLDDPHLLWKARAPCSAAKNAQTPRKIVQKSFAEYCGGETAVFPLKLMDGTAAV